MSYLGSKGGSGIYQAIISLMPPHDVYIEPFLGSGQIFLKKPRARLSVLNDLSPSVIDDFGYAAGSDLIIKNECAIRLIDDYVYDGHELVYLDPPYLHETRTSKNRYEFEMTDSQHVELLNVIKQKNAKFIISGYPSKLYSSMLDQWCTKNVQVMTRGGVRTEQIWYNFDAKEAFYSVFAGDNFTDRQRIKRKAERWANKFMALPDVERLAIMNRLIYGI